jgi:arylsulfatase A-like enzyme
LDGVDLSPLLFGGEALAPRRLFWECWGQKAARDGDWKLICVASDHNDGALFNLAEDAAEETDLSADHPERAVAMRCALEKWCTDVSTGATQQPE